MTCNLSNGVLLISKDILRNLGFFHLASHGEKYPLPPFHCMVILVPHFTAWVCVHVANSKDMHANNHIYVISDSNDEFFPVYSPACKIYS